MAIAEQQERSFLLRLHDGVEARHTASKSAQSLHSAVHEGFSVEHVADETDDKYCDLER